jgi:hypothetical protein
MDTTVLLINFHLKREQISNYVHGISRLAMVLAMIPQSSLAVQVLLEEF